MALQITEPQRVEPGMPLPAKTDPKVALTREIQDTWLEDRAWTAAS